MRHIEPRAIAGELAEMIPQHNVDAAAWFAFSRRLTELIPGTRTMFMANDLVAGVDIPLVQYGFDEIFVHNFGEYYCFRSPWSALNSKLKTLSPVRTEVTMPASSFKNTEFYNDFLSRIGDCDAATGMKIWGEAGRNAEFAVHYASAHDERIDRVLTPVLRTLGPLMSDAFAAMRIRMERQHSSQRKTVVEAMIDPAFVVTRTGRVKTANAAAQALVAQSDLIRIAAGDKLQILAPDAARIIADVIKTVAEGGRITAGNEIIRIGGPGRVHTVTAYPIATQMAIGFEQIMPSEACVLLIVRPLVEIAARPADVLADRFGLTHAEARLAELLMRGASLQEATVASGIRYSTGRSQLKAIFAKLNVHRQSELVAKLLATLKMP